MNLKSIFVAAGILLFAGWMTMSVMDSRSAFAAQDKFTSRYQEAVDQVNAQEDPSLMRLDRDPFGGQSEQRVQAQAGSIPRRSLPAYATPRVNVGGMNQSPFANGPQAENPFATGINGTQPAMVNRNFTAPGFQQAQSGLSTTFANPNSSSQNYYQNLWPRGVNQVFDLSVENATRKIQGAENEDAREEAIDEARTFLENEYDRHLSSAQKKIDVLNERLKSLNEQMDKRRDAKQRLVKLKLETIINNADGIGWPAEPSPNYFDMQRLNPFSKTEFRPRENHPQKTAGPNVASTVRGPRRTVNSTGTVTQISKNTGTIKFKQRNNQHVNRNDPIIVKRGNSIVGQGRVLRSDGIFSIAQLSSAMPNQVQVADQVTMATHAQSQSFRRPESGLAINPFLVKAIETLEQEKFEEFLFQFTPPEWLRDSLNESRLDTLVQKLKTPKKGPGYKDLLVALKAAKASRLTKIGQGTTVVKQGIPSYLQPGKRFVFNNDEEFKVEIWHPEDAKRLAVSITFYNDDESIDQQFFATQNDSAE